MSRELLRVNPLTGSKSELVIDPNDDSKIGIAWEQRIDKIFDGNQAMEEAHSQAGQDMRLAARVPIKVWMQWQEEGITNDPVLLKRRLNDLDNQHMRVWKGKL